MKLFYQIFFTVLFFISLPVGLHANENYFEDYSLTVSLQANAFLNMYKEIEVAPSAATGYQWKYINFDTTKSFAPAVEVTGAYNWKIFFLGLSVFGIHPQRLETTYRDGFRGQKVPYYIDQYVAGALFEAGLCNSNISAGNGYYYVNRYNNATYHIGMGIGPCYRSIESDIKQIEGSDYGWIMSLRYQSLLFSSVGIELEGRGLFIGNTPSAWFGCGIFYKVI